MRYWLYEIGGANRTELVRVSDADNNEGKGYDRWAEAFEVAMRTNPLNYEVIGLRAKIPAPYKFTFQQDPVVGD